jgi:hypothetical protein
MNAAAIQTVRPAGARYEALLLVIATALVLTVLALYVGQRGVTEAREPLNDWQISAFETLTGPDQAIYNALFTAKDDVPYLYEDINMFNQPGQKFRWPTLRDFQDSLLPPFYQDNSWTQNGSLKWTLIEPLAEGEMQGSTMYLGTDGTHASQGSFLLVIGHVHAGFQNNNAIVIWWNPKNHVVMPQSGFRDSLILAGWREVVPHSGAQEVKRIFGDAPDATSTQDQQQADAAIQDLFGNP